MYVYRLHTKSICDADDTWYREFDATHRCARCHALKGRLRLRGIDVLLQRPPDIAALNYVSRAEVELARRDFLELFAHEAQTYLKLGRVLLKDGSPCDEYATYIAEKPLILRGGAKSHSWTCDVCGTFRYRPGLDWYVIRASLTGQPLYECEFGGLIVTAELRNRIERGRWKGIYVTKIPVVDEPQDGIAEFPENYYQA
jgi:hypothetical protein